MTEERIRCLIILRQVWDLLFIRARTPASSLKICWSLFSKSSPWILKIAFQMREKTPLPFFAGGEELDSLLSPPSTMPLSSAIATFPKHKSKSSQTMLNQWYKYNTNWGSFPFRLNKYKEEIHTLKLSSPAIFDFNQIVEIKVADLIFFFFFYWSIITKAILWFFCCC